MKRMNCFLAFCNSSINSGVWVYMMNHAKKARVQRAPRLHSRLSEKRTQVAMQTGLTGLTRLQQKKLMNSESTMSSAVEYIKQI